MDWQRIEPTSVQKVGWKSIVTKTFKLPNDTIATFDTVHLENFSAAGVIAITQDKEVVIARQFRPGPERIMDEIPGGIVDEGEDPETAAKRELLEETGYEATNLRYLGAFNRDAYINGKWYYYLATNCKRVNETPEVGDDEFIDVILKTIPEFITDAKKGLMADPFAVLAAYDELVELNEEEIKR